MRIMATCADGSAKKNFKNLKIAHLDISTNLEMLKIDIEVELNLKCPHSVRNRKIER